MPSQIKVDEIKNVAGQYEIKTNTFKGQTTAGSITVQGEGTATTNLQQGLCKVWVQMQTESGHIIEDSLNVTSLTDPGAGKATFNINNNMANGSYSWATGICNGGGFNDTSTINVDNTELPTTSVFKFYAFMNSGLNDAKLACVNIHGDLA